MSFLQSVKQSFANKKAAQRLSGHKTKNTKPVQDYTGKAASFDRDLLPEPEVYYRAEFGDSMRKTSKGWIVRCPFHDDSTPSATVFYDGGFHCFACGVHCCDVLAFHAKLHGLGFKDAARALGAWRAEQ